MSTGGPFELIVSDGKADREAIKLLVGDGRRTVSTSSLPAPAKSIGRPSRSSSATAKWLPPFKIISSDGKADREAYELLVGDGKAAANQLLMRPRAGPTSSLPAPAKSIGRPSRSLSATAEAYARRRVFKLIVNDSRPDRAMRTAQPASR